MNIQRDTCSVCNIKSKIVSNLSLSELRDFERGSKEIKFEKKKQILIEGLPSPNIFYIRSGLIKIHKFGESNQDQILKIVKKGGFIGMHSIFAESYSSFSATTIVDTECCIINKDSFIHFFQTNSAFAQEVLSYLCSEELNFYKRLLDFQKKNVTGKVASILLEFSSYYSHENPFLFPLSKSEVASLIASTRESVSRAIHEFERSGIIILKGKNISITDIKRLQTIAENG